MAATATSDTKSTSNEENSKLVEDNNHADNQAVTLEKTIGIPQGMAIIVGVIVGSGIFVSPVGVLRQTHSVGMAFVMWGVCGIFSAIGAICYAELGVTIPRSGGEYIYILKSFGALPAFMCLWITYVTIGCVSTAANSLLFAEYLLKAFYLDCEVPFAAIRLVAFLGVALLTVINCFNVKWATKVAIVFTLCKVAALIIITIIGFVYLAKGRTENFQDSFENSNTSPGGMALSFYAGFWAYAGWNYLNFLTEEMINPARNMPIAIILSLLLTTVVYLTANVAYLAVLSPEEMMSTQAVAMLFAARTMGVMAWTMPLFIGLSIFGSMNGEMLSMSRLCWTGATEGHMPSLLAMIDYKRRTPSPSIYLMFFLTIIFQQYEEVQKLIELTGFAFTLICALSIAALLYLRWKRPDIPRPFKLPLVIPIFLLIWTLFILVVTVKEQPSESMQAILIMVLGIPIYWFGVSWKNKPQSIESVIDRVTSTVQKVLLVVPQDKPFDEM